MQIGPFDILRWEFVVGSWIIAFRTACWWCRAFSFVVVVLLPIWGIARLLEGEWRIALLAIGLIVLIFVVGPLLRYSRRNQCGVILRIEDDGLSAEAPAYRITYRWLTLKRSHLFRLGLIIMIHDRAGIIVPSRVAPRETLLEFKRLLEEGKAGSVAAS